MSPSLFTGWPLDAPDAFGRLAFAEDGLCLREALWNLLMTSPGERLMRPAFGCKIWELMFESINASTWLPGL